MPSGELKRRLAELELGDHLYLLYADEEERLAGLGPALEEAFDRGHRCLYFAEEATARPVLASLEERGVDVAGRREEGDLEVIPLDEARRDDGSFEIDPVVDVASGKAREALEEGYDGLWWIVEIFWPWRPEVSGEDIQAFEARLFDELRDSPIVALCQFDRRRLSDELLAEVLRAHPLAIFGDEVYPNPFHIPPKAVLDEYEITRADWMLRQLERARATEIRLRRSERRLRTILDRAPDIIVRVDRDLRYLYANPALDEYVEGSADEMTGRPLGEAPEDPESLDPWLDGIRHALETGTEQTVEGPLATARGKRWFDTRIVPEPGPGGEPETAILLARDVTEERRARQELEETARLLRKTLASLKEAVFIVQPRDRIIVYCNAAAEEMFGYERDELVGADTRKIHVDQESFRGFGEKIEEALEGAGSYRDEFRMQRADGTTFPSEHVVTLLDPAEGPGAGVVSVVRDVTEEREARRALELYAERLESLRELDRALLGARSEEELVESATERVRTLLDSWRASVVLLSADDPESYLLASSTAGEGARVNRHRTHECAAELAARLEPGEVFSVDHVEEGDEEAVVPEARELEDRGLRSYFAVPVVVEGRRFGALNVGYDEPEAFSEMTVELAREMATHLGLALRQARLLEEVDRATAQRERAERRAERLEVRLEHLLDGLEVGVARARLDGTLLNVNEAYARILGYGSPEELEGTDIRTHLARPERWDRVLEGEGAFGTSFPEREVRVQRADGSTIWVAGWGRRVETPDGEEVLEGIIRDVTKRKRLEEQVLQIGTDERKRIGRELHDQLGQQLTGIAFLARTLLGDGEGGEGADAVDEDAVRRIEEEARDAIARLRNLARGLDPSELDDQGLPDALAELAEESRRFFGVEVEVEVDPTMPVGGDEPIHLYRIVQEAVTNAVRHGGAECIRIRAEGRDDARVLEIEDDGSGMAEPSSDDGLGLRTMRYRCEALGGELDIETGAGEGTTVRCRLPAEPVPSRTGGGIP